MPGLRDDEEDGLEEEEEEEKEDGVAIEDLADGFKLFWLTGLREVAREPDVEEERGL